MEKNFAEIVLIYILVFGSILHSFCFYARRRKNKDAVIKIQLYYVLVRMGGMNILLYLCGVHGLESTTNASKLNPIFLQ